MAFPDSNVTNVAIPTIQRSLHLSVSGLEWVVSSYLLTLAGLLLVGGRLSDVFGRRRMFLIGTAVFTFPSLAAGLAGSGEVLIASRAVQGVGAALLMPPTLAIIMAAFTNLRERNMAVGIWAAAGALALFALTYALIEGNVRGWTSPLILAAFAVAAVAAAAFGAIESRTAHPMVDLGMFRRREFSGGTGTIMIWAFGILGIYFFTSLYLQLTLGFSPTEAGLAFVPMALCVALFAAIAPLVEARAGAHRTVAFGMLLMVVGLVLFARLGLHAGYASLLPGFMLFGAGAGLMNVPLTNAVMHATPPARAGIASALLNASREVAGLLGITIIGAVLRTRQSAALRAGAGPVHAFVDGYHAGLLVTIALLAVGVLVSYLSLRPRSGVTLPADESVVGGELATVDELAGELMADGELAVAASGRPGGAGRGLPAAG